MASLPKTARGCRTGSSRTLRRCGRRRFVLLAFLTATLFTILCGASLNYRSLKSFATNPMIWSRRWRRWWGSLGRDTLAKACTSFRSRIEAVFTADGSFIEYVDCQYVSLLIFFYFTKIGWLSALLFHFRERRKKFRIYRCHPVDEVVEGSGIGFSWLGATGWRFCCKTQKEPVKCLYQCMYTLYGVLFSPLWLKSEPGWPATPVSTWQQFRVGQIVLVWVSACYFTAS